MACYAEHILKAESVNPAPDTSEDEVESTD